MSAATASRGSTRDRNAAVTSGIAGSKPGLKPSSKFSRSQTPTTTRTPSDYYTTLKKSLSGKENTRPGLKGNSEGRVRLSTSVPRGRSPSPSQVFRVFKDGAKGGESVGSKNRGGSNGSRKRSVSRDGKENSEFGVEVGKSKEIRKESGVKLDGLENNVGGFRALNGVVSVKDVNFTLKVRKSNETSDFQALKGVVSGRDVTFNSKLRKSSEMSDLGGLHSGLKASNHVKVGDLSVKKCGSDTKVDSVRGSGVKCPENDKGLESVSGGIGVKYPSKLHEKLAFLEGKVKRIASDIKRTKEMLDMNNPDASKMVLSEIQEKVSGIEMAMGLVASDSSKVGLDGNGGSTSVVLKEMDEEPVLAKGLNSKELEARLFPHQKLLRYRMSMKSSSGSSQTDNESNILETSNGLKVEENSPGPIRMNKPIAVEYLVSLSKDDTKSSARDIKMGYEFMEVKEAGDNASGKDEHSPTLAKKNEDDLILLADESLDDFDDQENKNEIVVGEGAEDLALYQVNKICSKISTGGWFMSEGESVLISHDDGSCTFYDIINSEEKAVYKAPSGISPNMWRDCWIIRAPSADGCSGRYVVAASAGNTLDSGFCSWDFYARDVRAFHVDNAGTTNSRTILGPLPNSGNHRRNAFSSALLPESRQWWYRPCGPLLVSTASSQREVKLFDIRDGELLLKWQVQKTVSAMDYSSPIQWRNRGKVVVAEADTINVWDVNSLHPNSLLSVSLSGQSISALHVNNTDAESSGGVRQRVTSAEAEGNDGVFCTADSVNVLDFRHPSGIGLKIPKVGFFAHSVYGRGDIIYVGCENMRCAGKKQPYSEVEQFSLRKGRLVTTYCLPESDAHPHYSAITQVWGNSDHVMAVCGHGLYVFDMSNDEVPHSFSGDCSQKVKEVIGPDDLYRPTFDYAASRILLISRDRPAMWRHLM